MEALAKDTERNLSLKYSSFMEISSEWIDTVSDQRLAAKLQAARQSLQNQNPREALLLLAQGEQELLCQKDPDPEVCSELARLRVRVAALETDKEG